MDDSAEGTASVASLTFTPANWNIPLVVTITGVDDLDDGDATYTLILSAATGTDPSNAGIDPGDPTLINADDDTAGPRVVPFQKEGRPSA